MKHLAFIVALLATGSAWGQVVAYPNACTGASTGTNGAPINRSFTTTASSAVTIASANQFRLAVHIQIPSTLTGGAWINFSGTVASAGGSGSFFYAAGTELNFSNLIVGNQTISFYTTTGSVVVPFTEC